MACLCRHSSAEQFSPQRLNPTADARASVSVAISNHERADQVSLEGFHQHGANGCMGMSSPAIESVKWRGSIRRVVASSSADSGNGDRPCAKRAFG
jgi:hypothetical protein